MLLHELGDVVGVEAQEPPPLDDGQATLLHQATDMAHIHTQLLGYIVNRQQPSQRSIGVFCPHA